MRIRGAHVTRKTLLIVSTLISVLVVGVYAYIDLTQTFPTSPTIPIAGTAVTTSPCNSSSTPLTYPTTMPVGPAAVMVTCGTGAAFTVTTGGSDTPTYSLPTGTGVPTGLSLGYVASTATSCNPYTSIAPGATITLSAGSYNYCVVYGTQTAATSIPSFTISWSS